MTVDGLKVDGVTADDMAVDDMKVDGMTADDVAADDVTAESATVEIVLNGAPRAVPAQHTLHDLVEALGLGKQALALAVNRSVVPRQWWPQRALQAQDQVDIVRAIGGG